MTKSKVIFRADGNSQMGLGHVIRSLALAEMLSTDFECHFAIRNPLPSLREQILSVCKTIIALPETGDHISEVHFLTKEVLAGDEIVVLDGYHFQTEYQKIIKEAGNKLVCIDDIHSCHFVADAIINHAGSIKPDDYSAAGYTSFYLGPRYALLRKPFREKAYHRNSSERSNSGLFICLGGADPENHTLSVLQECEQKNFLGKCFVVVGAAYRFQDALNQFARESSLDIQILSELSAEDLEKLMSQCPTAITSPSSVAYEYLSIGGNLFLFKIADNQERLFQFLTKEGLAFSFENFPNTNNQEVENAIKAQSTLFDGQQELRLKKVFWSIDFKIRPATKDDCRFYYDLANDPEIRAASYNTKPILFEEHVQWFTKKISDEHSFLFVGECRNEAVGQIRFDLKEKELIISYAVAPNARRKGFGKLLLSKGIASVQQHFPSKIPIAGYVKKDNLASQRSFESLGFMREEANEFPNSYKFILSS